jgi:hypothetical protein
MKGSVLVHQTFGKCDYNGCPDLIAVRVINGEEGYISSKEERILAETGRTGYLNIYKPTAPPSSESSASALPTVETSNTAHYSVR